MQIKINVQQDINETEVQITCKKIDQDILNLERHLQLFSKTLATKQKDGKITFVSAKDIYYIEVVDNRTFIYGKSEIYETEFRLYELEEKLAICGFFRASKSLIMNIHMIESLKPELNRTLLALFKNGEKINISRQYTKELKKLLGFKGGWV